MGNTTFPTVPAAFLQALPPGAAAPPPFQPAAPAAPAGAAEAAPGAGAAAGAGAKPDGVAAQAALGGGDMQANVGLPTIFGTPGAPVVPRPGNEGVVDPNTANPGGGAGEGQEGPRATPQSPPAMAGAPAEARRPGTDAAPQQAQAMEGMGGQRQVNQEPGAPVPAGQQAQPAAAQPANVASPDARAATNQAAQPPAAQAAAPPPAGQPAPNAPAQPGAVQAQTPTQAAPAQVPNARPPTNQATQPPATQAAATPSPTSQPGAAVPVQPGVVPAQPLAQAAPQIAIALPGAAVALGLPLPQTPAAVPPGTPVLAATVRVPDAAIASARGAVAQQGSGRVQPGNPAITQLQTPAQRAAAPPMAGSTAALQSGLTAGPVPSRFAATRPATISAGAAQTGGATANAAPPGSRPPPPNGLSNPGLSNPGLPNARAATALAAAPAALPASMIAGNAVTSGPDTPALPGFAARVLTEAAPFGAGSAPSGSRSATTSIENPLLQGLPMAGTGQGARPLDPAAVQAALRLPGPVGALLQQGVEPMLALGVQLAWEGAMLGGAGGGAGPVWDRWGLDDAGALDALVLRLTGQSAGAEDLAGAAQRPSQTAATLLGLAGTAIPSGVLNPALQRLDSRQAEPALLGLANPGGAPGLNGLVRLVAAPGTLEGAVAFTAAGDVDAPLLLAMLGKARNGNGSMPGIALGGGLMLHTAAPAGRAPASATFAWNGPAPAGAAGAAPLLARAAQAVLGALRGRTVAAVGASLKIPLGEVSLGAHVRSLVRGTVRLADGESVTLGPDEAALRRGGGLSGTPPLGVGAPPRAETAAVLALGGGALDGGGDKLDTLGAHVRYEDRRAVKLDLAPAVPSSPAWRLDDTGVSASLQADGIDAALNRAKRLHRRLQAGKLTLDDIPPGHGIDTWDGSPAWLGLAGVPKPAALGVLPGEAAPPRLDLSRAADGAWLVIRRGGAEGRDTRRPHPPDAAESIGLFHDAVFGLAPDLAASPPGGVAGGLALRGFRRARASMAVTLPDARAAARAQEAWGMVARLWAGALERMNRAGTPGRLSPHGLPAVQAGALREIAAWSGAVPAWHAASMAGLDRAALLAACDPSVRAALAQVLAPAAALACLLGEPPHTPADAAWAAPERLVAAGTLEALHGWGRAALHDVSEGRPDALHWGDAVALAAHLGRLIPAP